MPCFTCYARAYSSGVEAVCRIAARYSAADWRRVGPCAPWTALDVLRHLQVTASESHVTHLYALEFGPKELMSQGKLAEFNQLTLQGLPIRTAPFHLREFVEAATRHLGECAATPEVPSFSYHGRVWNVACGIGVLAVEWHLHAWDLAATIGEFYRPRSPALLAAAFRAGTAYLPPPPTDTWDDVLLASGRWPGPNLGDSTRAGR
ncbi:maleylpyruvate isomerase N-terminal domain-containing protein [Micromonospora sp. NPDC050397]|uniref:maleylpyruvate isomerase N-terminal domain-containing protein n=1 Tax=Micromonospora sp. NPDC050397 TaxID=3364279 RepID=UPI00384FAAA4